MSGPPSNQRKPSGKPWCKQQSSNQNGRRIEACIPGTMCQKWQWLHWRNQNNTWEENKWTQRSSDETWCDKWHSTTCMDQAAQGGLAGSDSQACGDQPHKVTNNWSPAHPPAAVTFNLDCVKEHWVQYGTPPLNTPPPRHIHLQQVTTCISTCDQTHPLIIFGQYAWIAFNSFNLFLRHTSSTLTFTYLEMFFFNHVSFIPV